MDYDLDALRADMWLAPYLLGWAGLGDPKPWGAAMSSAMEVAFSYGLIKGESDATLTDKGQAAARALVAMQEAR